MYMTLLIVSTPIIAANNRGETEGNLQPLQRLSTPDDGRTVLSGYAIRRAIREAMQANGATMWRTSDADFSEINPAGYSYVDRNGESQNVMKEAVPRKASDFDDTILFGYMLAAEKLKETASDTAVEGESEEDRKKREKEARKEKAAAKAANGGKDILAEKGSIDKQRSAVCVSTAVSTTPYTGDVAFVQGLKGAAPSLNPFSVERHYTRYQFTISVDLTRLRARPGALRHLLNTLTSLQVGGNHAANSSELSPDLIAWRFHKTPGAGGMALGVGFNQEPGVAVNIDPLRERARQLGYTFQTAGNNQPKTIVEGLASIASEAEVYLK